MERVHSPTHGRASEQEAAKKAKTPAKDPASKKKKLRGEETERRKNCTEGLCLPIMQADQGLEAVAVANEMMTDHPSTPALQQPAIQDKPSAQSDPDHTPQHLAREEQWDAAQDMTELGQHLHEAHRAFKQSSDTFHTFLE